LEIFYWLKAGKKWADEKENRHFEKKEEKKDWQ